MANIIEKTTTQSETIVIVWDAWAMAWRRPPPPVWAIVACVVAISVHGTAAARIGGATFANGKSREGALVGYSESSTLLTDADASEVPAWCVDADSNCESWARTGECDTNPGFMKASCARSCDACPKGRAKDEKPTGTLVFLDVKITYDKDAVTYIDIDKSNTLINQNAEGRIVLELFTGSHPKTSENFKQLCIGTPGWGYKNAKFQRVIPGFMNQAGSFPKSGSIYGGNFPDENFSRNHDAPFLLSMANAGPDTNGDQFFITVAPQPHLDGKHMVFGEVMSGEETVMAINRAGTQSGKTKAMVVITDAGVMEE